MTKVPPGRIMCLGCFVWYKLISLRSNAWISLLPVWGWLFYWGLSWSNEISWKRLPWDVALHTNFEVIWTGDLRTLVFYIRVYLQSHIPLQCPRYLWIDIFKREYDHTWQHLSYLNRTCGSFWSNFKAVASLRTPLKELTEKADLFALIKLRGRCGCWWCWCCWCLAFQVHHVVLLSWKKACDEYFEHALKREMFFVRTTYLEHYFEHMDLHRIIYLDILGTCMNLWFYV